MTNRYTIPIGKPFSAPPPHRVNRIILSGLLGLILYITTHYLAPLQRLPINDQMKAAALTMTLALKTIRAYKIQEKFPFDKSLDPNRTGLIGPPRGAYATSLGNLEAKRTTTNPNMAALITHWLQRAYIREGDRVAIGSSGSFPALMIAAVTAVQTLKAKPLAIISLGASSYGATEGRFNLLDIYMLLYDRGIFKHKPLAVSWGGEEDLGEKYDITIRQQLEARIRTLAIPFIYSRDLQQNINKRLNLYRKAAQGGKISLFINSGGNEANLGQDPAILRVKPGLNLNLNAPSAANRGVLFEWAAGGIPCIHLLFIKGLSQTYGLPWDPIPLPRPAENRLQDPDASPSLLFWFMALLYFLGIFFIFCQPLKTKDQE